MPQRYTTQQARDQYAKLPRVLKEAIFSAEIAEKMYDIGHRNGLNIEKTGFLAEEAGYIVLGLTHPREFVGQLTERLEITTDKAKEIAQQVNHEIFFPLHEALKQTHGVDVKEEVIEKAEPLLHEQARTVPPAAGTRTAQTDAHEQHEQKYTNSTNIKHEQREQIKPQGETIDLRQQYKPKMPEGTPPSKIPPINLRVQREGIPQGGIIPKQGISFPQQKHEQTPHQSFQHGAGQARTVPPAAGTRTPLEQAQTGQAARTDGAGENVKTSPFGISSGRLIEDLEKHQQTRTAPPTAVGGTPTDTDSKDANKPDQRIEAQKTAAPEPKEMLKPSEPMKPPASSPPPNIPLKEEMPQPAQKQDPYREPVE